MQDFYVYGLFRLNGQPCYIGKGRRGRWTAHFKHSRNKHLARIIAKSGGALPVVKIREGLTNAEATATEIALIAAIGRHAKGGPLVNMTDGGEGVQGLVHSPEARAKMSSVHKGKKLSAQQILRLKEVHTGRKHSREAREKISAKQRGQRRSAEFCEKMRRQNLGRKITEEQRRKISDATRGKPHSAAHNANMRAAVRGIPKSEAHKQKLRDAHLGKKHTPDSIQRMSEVKRGKRHSPKALANLKAGQKRRREREAAAKEALG